MGRPALHLTRCEHPRGGPSAGPNQILADDARYPPHFDLKIRPGDRLTGDLAGFTGLIVFWKEGCPWCEKEREDLARLCEHVPVLLVSNTPGKPELASCTRRGDWHLYHDWGIPGAPSHVWIEKGVVGWVDLGYTERLTDLVGVLTERVGRSE
ncbi:TlpA family protein disulfide reductase [Deinococcota bacterium DY0809b]